MNTQFTDAVAEKAFHEDGADDYEGYVAMLRHARRLELDRAALMAIAERVADDDELPSDGDMVIAILKRDARSALSAARANFPTP